MRHVKAGLARWPAALFAVLAVLFLWRATLTGEAFVPASLLRYVQPWATANGRPAWNPLMYDSVGQFYPWRKLAHDSVQAGRLPLWNPYQFCGAPFLANSQSAPLYPGNLLFYLLSPDVAAGWTVALHLLLAALFTWLLLRDLGASDMAGALAGVAFAFSTWQVSWLHLPTFLCTSCWLPLAAMLSRRLAAAPSLRRAAALGFVLGLALLGGHLQIGFYVLLACGLLAAGLCCRAALRRELGRACRGGALFVAALALAGMVCAPQLLPSLELSRRSHRTARPSAEGYAAYASYAPQPGALGTLFLPDLYGNPSNGDSPYFGLTRRGDLFNYAEGALYVGLPTLLLAGYAVTRRRQPGRLLPYLAGLGALALLMALGTAVDAVFYFGIPGFASSGSPARALVLWAFAASCLAGLGYDKLLRDDATPARTAVATSFGLLVVGGLAVWAALGQMSAAQEQVRSQAWDPQIARQAGIYLLSAAAVVVLAAGKMKAGWQRALPLALVVVDLFATGINYNPTAPREQVYPATPLTDQLAAVTGHDRVAPINHGWSFAGPQAVLPPNGATVFGLRDVQGYDSLFPGKYKAFMDRLSGGDSSPPEVGNMVFAKDAASPLLAAAGVRWLVSMQEPALPAARQVGEVYVAELPGAPGRASALTDVGRPVPITWRDDTPTRVSLSLSAPAPATLRLADERYPGWHAAVDGAECPIGVVDGVFRSVRVGAGAHTVSFEYRPASFQVGLFLLLAALGGGGFAVGARSVRRAAP